MNKELDRAIQNLRKTLNGLYHSEDFSFDIEREFNRHYYEHEASQNPSLYTLLEFFLRENYVLRGKNIDYKTKCAVYTFFYLGYYLGEDTVHGYVTSSFFAPVTDNVYRYLQDNGIILINNHILRIIPGKAEKFLRLIESEHKQEPSCDLLLSQYINNLEKKLQEETALNKDYKIKIEALQKEIDLQKKKKWYQFWK